LHFDFYSPVITTVKLFESRFAADYHRFSGTAVQFSIARQVLQFCAGVYGCWDISNFRYNANSINGWS